MTLKSVSDSINNNKEANMNDLYEALCDFINDYNGNLIEGYDIKKNKNSKLSLMIIREHVYHMVRSIRTIKLTENNVNYYVLKTDSPDKIKLFICYIIFYFVDAIHLNNYYVGVDFEFNQRKIALCQLSFYPKRNKKIIFVIDPNFFSTQQLDILVKCVFTAPIKKIVHGSDSLDIPYIYEELLRSNISDMLKFIKNVIDTRFLCESVKLYYNEDKKCSIYDAMLYFNTINKSKYDELNQINDSMGPVQDINWVLAKMSSFNLKYATYDVLFLKDFLNDIFKKVANDKKIKKTLKLIIELTHFVFLEKYNILTLSSDAKKTTDPMNNYLIKIDNGNKSIISIYNDCIEHVNLKNIILKNLLGINYFKSTLTFVLKLIVYYNINNKHTVYMNKHDTFNGKISIRNIFAELNNLKMKKMHKFFAEFHKSIKKEI
uniref:3'-5' exonuclease domain-containing protein n=1 Tax=viral metagenome TaxID=1070528 RepID=A0A6C0EDR8_9ZZZZ